MVKKKLDVGVVRRRLGLGRTSPASRPGAFFMIGFPTETRAEIERTVDFALSLPLDDRVQFTKATPLPAPRSTNSWKRGFSQGTEIDWSKFNYYAFDAQWCPVPAEEISRIQRRGHWRFYLRPGNFLRILARPASRTVGLSAQALDAAFRIGRARSVIAARPPSTPAPVALRAPRP